MILRFILLFSFSLSGMNLQPIFTHEINTAAAAGDLAKLKQLILKHGQQFDKESASVALWCALNKSQFKAAEFLTTHYAEVNVWFSQNETLLENILNSKPVLRAAEWLLAHGADPDFCAAGGITPLAQLCAIDDVESVYDLKRMQLLCRYGADPNAGSVAGTRCLHSLMYKPDVITNKFELTISLIVAGADINAPEREGFTPLHIACESGMNATAAYLLARGAKKVVKNKDGKTPIELIKDNPDLYTMLAADALPPVPEEAIKIEKEMQKLKIKLL